MFSGIVESVQPIIKSQTRDKSLRIWVKLPKGFDDLKTGDSVAVNGVCLTIEKIISDSHPQDPQLINTIQFCLAYETLEKLKIKTSSQLENLQVNLERSLRFGDRMHGHLVSGHVECLGEVLESFAMGDSWILKIQLPTILKDAIWTKGSVTVHGVSLTVNSVERNPKSGLDSFSVCLIPETIERTNLTQIKIGETVNLEADYFAKVVLHWIQERGQSLPFKKDVSAHLLKNTETL